MAQFPPHKIRNFCITAHIDHGKTTLSSKLLALTGVLQDSKMNELYLDKLRVEKERGITVRAQTATMFYEYDEEIYVLNLIDTPGHVDFSYEVSRSMAACEGALLLVDAVKGIQAQTVANWWLAQKNNLYIIPCINKVDLALAQPSKVIEEFKGSFGYDSCQVLKISAVTGLGVHEVLSKIVEDIPYPEYDPNKPFRCLLFDSWYQDNFVGIVCLVKVLEGNVKPGYSLIAASTNKEYTVSEVGIMHPEPMLTNGLFSGQVGYIKMGMKSTSESRVGDTFFLKDHPVDILPGYKKAMPMVYAGVYPESDSDFGNLRNAVEKLLLTDASIITKVDLNDVLGMGYRCGFLGLLHMEVFIQRLREEYNMKVILTSPNVPILIELHNGQTFEITQASQYPTKDLVKSTSEMYVNASIFSPKEYLGTITQLCIDRRGTQIKLDWIDEMRVHMIYHMPLSEVIFDFFDKLKQFSSGYATLDYEEVGYEESDIVKLQILLNGELADPLSILVHRSRVESIGRKMTEKLKETIHRQMFEIRIQAAVGSKIIARETIKPFRKDVTAKCYGGDITRKRKLLEKQKEGKKRMRSIGNVELSSETFMVATKLT